MSEERRRYQERVARLLEVIDAKARQRLRLEAAGAGGSLLAEIEQKEALARARLAELVGGRAPRLA